MMKSKEELMIEIEQLYLRDKELYDHMKYENNILYSNICSKCKNCKYYKEISILDSSLHCCNDIWSGKYAPGWHPIYGETLDVCTSENGYKQK